MLATHIWPVYLIQRPANAIIKKILLRFEQRPSLTATSPHLYVPFNFPKEWLSWWRPCLGGDLSLVRKQIFLVHGREGTSHTQLSKPVSYVKLSWSPYLSEIGEVALVGGTYGWPLNNAEVLGLGRLASPKTQVQLQLALCTWYSHPWSWPLNNAGVNYSGPLKKVQDKWARIVQTGVGKGQLY